jgi:hypothetical protein
VTDPYDPTLPLPAYPVPAEPVLVSVGDISVTQSTVIVPHGRFPLRGTTWTVQDSSQRSEAIPTWAIVMAVLLVWFCLLGLLFLLVKETKYTGFLAVTVVGDGLYHSVQLPPDPQTVSWATHQVNQARSLAAQAGTWA